ncbi:MAG TPA: serine/threonine-protein kinase [Terracidiphilus sp.]|jgi:non-specific serine/threonine protein kinase/serine/threonine-protein kinase
MTPERWGQIKEALGSALDLPLQERTAFLKEYCAGDDSLRHEVEVLLEGEQKVEAKFLDESCLADVAASLIATDENSWIGRRVGPYQVVEQIGAGGMGEVYRAFRADDQYRQEVALKVIREGQDSGLVITRFKNERQILASLEHPNIARLLEGSATEKGQPYFAMELIEGEPITDYCDHHGLTITERLRLFLEVCAAVQFAHQHLVIHRDIKPGNILVTTKGVPKLLDFGIAKILESDTAESFDATMTAFRVCTPRYGSPEQMQGGQMTTASDVYSLGVVLYETLTGRSPYRMPSGSPQEIVKAICTGEAQRPSTAVFKGYSAKDTRQTLSREEVSGLRGLTPDRLRKRLNGDLDNIVLKALEKDPRQRYRSVDQLQEDIRRHLENIPVVARTATAWYRASKFVIRHKTGVSFSAALALALVVGMVVTLYEAKIARQQRARAEMRFNDVRKLANSLIFEIHDSIRDLSGATPARRLLVARALEYLDSLSTEAAGDVSLERELANAYDRVGDLMGYNGAANLGDFPGALRSYQKALAIREAAASSNPKDDSLQLDVLNDYFRLSFVLMGSGDFAGALKTLQSGLPAAQKLAESHSDPQYVDVFAGIYWQTGNIQSSTGEFTKAAGSFRKAISIREPVAASNNTNPILRTHLAADYMGLATAYRGISDNSAALEASAKAIGILLDLSHADPTNATLREFLGEAYNNSAPLLERKGDVDRALDYYRKSNAIFSGLSKEDPANSLARQNTAFSDLGVARELALKHDPTPALAKANEAVAIFEHPEKKNRYDIEGQAESYAMLGMAYEVQVDRDSSKAMKIKHLKQAKGWLQKSLAIRDQNPQQSAAEPEFTAEVGATRRDLQKCESQLLKLLPN